MQKIFSEFPPTTAIDWKNQLIKDLKGEPYERLIWENENGLTIQPFYTQENFIQNYEPAFTHADWEVAVHIQIGSSKEINEQLITDLNRGATSISVCCKAINFEVAFNTIQLNYIQSTFIVDETSAVNLKKYLQENYNLSEINCSLIPEKLETSDDLINWQKVIALFENFKTIKTIKTISVNALPFHNLNCLAYYEIAIIFSALNEYLQVIKNPIAPIVIKTGVNSDYFIQIAKLRAIRRLWDTLKVEYNLNNEIYLIVETSLTNKSISDKYNNLLRTTVESMAAVAGGCNELIVTEFDVLFSENKKLSSRMAINQQLILKEESYFNKMADVACGSYYIESITDALAIRALETFKRFEREGGYFKCTQNHLFSDEIKIQANKKNELFRTSKQLAIGINKFKNSTETISLSAQQIQELKKLSINNTVLNFELENFFQ